MQLGSSTVRGVSLSSTPSRLAARSASRHPHAFPSRSLSSVVPAVQRQSCAAPSRGVSCAAQLDIDEFAKLLDSHLDSQLQPMKNEVAKLLDSQQAIQTSLKRVESQLGVQANQLGVQANQLGVHANQLGVLANQLGDLLEDQSRSHVVSLFGASYAKPLLALSVQDLLLVFPDEALYNSPSTKEVFRAPLLLATKATTRLVEDQVPTRLLQSFQEGLQAATVERVVTLQKLIKNHSSKFDKTLDLHSLALRVPTFSEGSLASIIEQAAVLASMQGRASVNSQDLDEALQQLLLSTTRPWSNDGVLLPWINKDGTINKANLGTSIGRMRDLPAKEALRRLRNVLVLPKDKQAEDLLACQSAGVMCVIAAAHPDVYLQPKLKLPSREMEWDMRGRLDIGAQGSYAYIDCGEAKVRDDYASAIAQLGLRLGVHRWLVEVCCGVQPVNIRLVGRLFVHRKHLSATYMDEAQRQKASTEWRFSLYVQYV